MVPISKGKRRGDYELPVSQIAKSLILSNQIKVGRQPQFKVPYSSCTAAVTVTVKR